MAYFSRTFASSFYCQEFENDLIQDLDCLCPTPPSLLLPLITTQSGNIPSYQALLGLPTSNILQSRTYKIRNSGNEFWRVRWRLLAEGQVQVAPVLNLGSAANLLLQKLQRLHSYNMVNQTIVCLHRDPQYFWITEQKWNFENTPYLFMEHATKSFLLLLFSCV